MATQIKQWCGWGGTDGAGHDLGSVSYQWDDTVAAGFPFGKLTAFTWANGSAIPEQVTLTLRPGALASSVAVGTVTSLPLAAGSACPVPVGTQVQLSSGPTVFTVATAVKVGDTAIAVTSQSNPSLIPAGTLLFCPLPAITIPASGQTAPLPAFYGGGTVGSSGSVNLTPLAVPMMQITSHGLNFVVPPADQTCVD